ncbi:MAG: hypothetical protein EPN89_03370 [Methylovulum sp.]|nr:MAG: hypothetical protein EPN89_03370 [Methylovulum sp.]
MSGDVHVRFCEHLRGRFPWVTRLILLADNPEQLRLWQTQISDFLQTTLRLRLKDDVRLQPVCQGIDFLGYRIFTHYRRVRPRVVAHCRAKLTEWARQSVRQHPHGLWIRTTAQALALLQAMLGSYWGHFSHAHSVRLRHALFSEFNWLPYLFSLSADGALNARWVLPGVTFAQQSYALQHSKPAGHCFIQRGCRFYEFALVPKLRLGNPVLEAPASSHTKLELRRPHSQAGAWERAEYRPEKLALVLANFRRLGIAYRVARQTGWLRHGTRRRELCEWFIPT